METSLRLKGDFTDSFTEWTDAYFNLLRLDTIMWRAWFKALLSIHQLFFLLTTPSRISKKETSTHFSTNWSNWLEVTNCASEFATLKDQIKFKNRAGHDGGGVAILVNFDISQLRFKSRYVIKIFNEICAPNDIKDSVMLANISSMRYVQTSNVREDVSKLISHYNRYDAEMSNSQKQPLSQKKKFFAKLLIRVTLISSHAIMQHQLHHFASTWDVFRSTVLRACQTVMEMEGSHQVSVPIVSTSADNPISASTNATNPRNNSLYGHNNSNAFREDVYLA
jgi:hypothetical protein